MSMLRREHIDVDLVVRMRRETVEQGEAMSIDQWKKEEKKKERQRKRGGEQKREKERERGARVWRKRRRQKERQRKEDGRILCQSNKKRRAWHGQHGAWHWPDARGLARLYRASVYGVTEYCYRGPCPGSRRAAAVSCTNFICPALPYSFSFSFFLFFLYTFLSRFFSLILCFLFFLFRFSALFDSHLPFLFSLLLHRSNNTILLRIPSWIVDVLLSLLLLFLSSRKTIHT